jgi:hypothetical protein
LIQSRGDKDPLDFLSEVISSENHYPVELKVTAANYLNPYIHSKRSVAPEPRFIHEPITVPEFTSIEEAETYLALLPARVGRGEISFDDAEKISLLTRNYIEATIDARKLELQIVAQGGSRDVSIRIEGGLRTMPGHGNVIMPTFNGHQIDGAATPALPEHQAPKANWNYMRKSAEARNC